MGDGWLGLVCNSMCIAWTLFVSVLFSLPTYFPVTKDNMNYASVITVAVITSSLCVSLSFTPSVHSPLFPVEKGSGISLGTLFCFRLWERNPSADGIYSARRHYKGPVSYTDGHKEPTKGSPAPDQSDMKGPDVTLKYVFVSLLID
jgi:hypothetical protein